MIMMVFSVVFIERLIRSTCPMASAMSSAVKSQIRTLLNQAQGSVGLLKTMNEVYAVLRDNHLMFKQKLHAKHIGCHESNRDGLGVAPDHVHSLIQDFYDFGYLENEIKWMAVELQGKNGEGTRAYNEELVRNSNGLLLHKHWMKLSILGFLFHLDLMLVLQVPLCSWSFQS